MVRDNRIKFYNFVGSPDLLSDANGNITAYSNNPLNGRIQAIYFEGGDYTATGSIIIYVSGTNAGLTATEGKILSMTSGTDIGHHMGEDWAVFPRVTTVTTAGVPISGANGYNEFGEIPIWSNLFVCGSGLGNAKKASGLTIVYI